jgi:hypothetical protein
VKNFNLRKAIIRDFGKDAVKATEDGAAFVFVPKNGQDHFVVAGEGTITILSEGDPQFTAPLSERGWTITLAAIIRCLLEEES